MISNMDYCNQTMTDASYREIHDHWFEVRYRGNKVCDLYKGIYRWHILGTNGRSVEITKMRDAGRVIHYLIEQYSQQQVR